MARGSVECKKGLGRVEKFASVVVEVCGKVAED